MVPFSFAGEELLLAAGQRLPRWRLAEVPPRLLLVRRQLLLLLLPRIPACQPPLCQAPATPIPIMDW